MSDKELIFALGLNLDGWEWQINNDKYVVNEQEGKALAKFILSHKEELLNN